MDDNRLKPKYQGRAVVRKQKHWLRASKIFEKVQGHFLLLTLLIVLWVNKIWTYVRNISLFSLKKRNNIYYSNIMINVRFKMLKLKTLQ